MNQVHFTFNHFFDYSIIVEQLQLKSIYIFNPNEFTIIFSYHFRSEHAIRYMEELCEPLNIQFTTTLGIAEDTE